MEAVLETKCLSSLAKVFPDTQPSEQPLHKASALLNETYSFQIAYRAIQGRRAKKHIRLRIESEIGGHILIRRVGLVPSELPSYPDHDEHIIRSAPGLYPDPLMPLGDLDDLVALQDQWRSVWLTIQLDGSVRAGTYPVNVIFENTEGEPLAQQQFELEVIAALLPEQTLIHTEWFHADCLASHYKVDVFSEEHWALIAQYVETAVAHGMNMILTPLFTPPLDTQIGGERPTVQLVDVEKKGASYTFSFERLKRWVELCRAKGVRYFEFSHLFTQWGAKHAPKIIASENGEHKRIFGWDTDATGGEYQSFLDQFLPELILFIRNNDLMEVSYFHVSDEPRLEHLAWYEKASQTMQRHVSGFPVIDALSNFEFYEQGLVRNPIPANNHIEPFLSGGVPNLWTYYCCSQYKDVSNRFFNLPSARNRIIGVQLYKFNIAGFLHWGYNFWYSQYSLKEIDPYRTTDADYAFPSGDAYLVYPHEDGPVESIRLEVFYEALQDLRALQLLESRIGREQVLKLIEQDLQHEITFSTYPREEVWLLSLREKVNSMIAEHSSSGSPNGSQTTRSQ